MTMATPLLKRCLVALVLSVCLNSAFSPPAPAEELTGRQIMEMKKHRHHKPSELAQIRMVLIDSDGSETERTMTSYQREFEGGLSRYLQVFTDPAGVRGVASLSWETESGQDDQWTFLPALGKLKRVVGGAKRSYFMGTDFANEDMTSENLNGHRYERQADAVLDGEDVYVIDAFPESDDEKSSTGYEHRRLYIRKDILVTPKIEFFERRTGKLMKILSASEFANVGGDAWRPKVSLMDNLKEKHKTRNDVLKYDFAANAVDPGMFKHRHIEQKKHMR